MRFAFSEGGKSSDGFDGVSERALASAQSSEPALESHARGLRVLLEDYERSLILSALGAVRGRQRNAAALLRIPATSLHEKMKRLGIRSQRARVRNHEPLCDPEVSASLRWTGTVRPGGTLELRGLNGPVRIEAANSTDLVEVIADRRGPRATVSSVEVRVVEHGNGVALCAVCRGIEASATTQAAALVRVSLVARVPPGLHVIARTVNDDIEVVGLTRNVDAETVNGRVRFVAPPVPSDIPSDGGEGARPADAKHA